MSTPIKMPEKETMNLNGIDEFYTAINELIYSNRFMYYVLINIKKIPTLSVPTLGVMQRKGERLPTLYFNPNFIMKTVVQDPDTGIKKTIEFNKKDRCNMVLHEILHVLLNHCIRGQKYSKDLMANLAMDVVVNDFLFQNYERYGQKPDYKNEKANLFDIAASKGSFKCLKNLNIKDYSFEEIYDILNNSKEGKEIDEMEKKIKIGVLQPGEHNWEGWEEVEQSPEMQGQIENLIRKALKDCNNNPGNLPGELQRFVDKLIKPERNWRDSLNYFVESSKLDTKVGTWRRLNRRFGFLAKGSRKDMKPNLAVVVDTSGSIYSDAKLLEQFRGYLDYVLESCQSVRVICIDTNIHSDVFYEKGQNIPNNFEGGGGTRLQPAWDRVKEIGEVDGIVALTDGFCEEFIETYGIPTVALITDNGTKINGIEHTIFFSQDKD